MQLTELSGELHQNLKVEPNAVNEFLSKQHVLAIAASEIPTAATTYPIFISRNERDGRFGCSVMTSFFPQQNLYAQNGKWDAVFRPQAALTYPLFLMQKGDGFCVGFDASSPAFSETEGKALFDGLNQASQHLAKVTQMLESTVAAVHQTDKFTELLAQWGLLKSIDLQVQFTDGTTNKITGLHTINEDAVKLLAADKLEKLNNLGYLAPIYAMLISIYQVNVLVTKHNQHSTQTISNVKIEVSKDPNQL